MIEIRPARPEEMAREKELWKLCFGDDDAYIDYFYAQRPITDTLVLLEDGVLWSMLALFPVEVVLPDGARLKSAYIYALATHPDVRKKGFGRFLLNYVDFYLKEQGMDCVTIVPAEAGLHHFFSSVGFSECFALRKMELMSYMVQSPSPDDGLAPVSPAEYGAIREGRLAGNLYVGYGEDVLAYQAGLSANGGGGLYKLSVDGEAGCACAELTGAETVCIKELLISPEGMSRAVALLAQELTAVRYHLRTPAFHDALPGSYPQPFAMIKWYHLDMEQAWRDYGRGYMGLGFD